MCILHTLTFLSQSLPLPRLRQTRPHRDRILRPRSPPLSADPKLDGEFRHLHQEVLRVNRDALDRLIQKIRLGEDRAADPYVALIKRLAVSDKVDFDAAKILISEYKKQKETNQT